MGHPEINNKTPFAFSPLFVMDEEGRPVVATIVKATFDVSVAGMVTLAEKQIEVDLEGKYYGDPETSSFRIEPEVAFVKPTTDCVLLGYAVSARPTTQMDVSFRVGPVIKTARVTGDRYFEDTGLGSRISRPLPFQMMPLVYERTFGGWDRTSENEKQHACEPRNPVGVGFVATRLWFMPGTPLPNIEDPRNPLTSYGGKATPVGFGFIGPSWHPRVKYAGTYDEAWTKNRSPLLAKDFDRRFFLSASEGLSTPEYLLGNEPVVVTGATVERNWSFYLPGIQPPECTVATRLGGDRVLVTNLDTVVVDAHTRQVTLSWRAFTELQSGPHDIRAIEITCANAPTVAVSPASSVTANAIY